MNTSGTVIPIQSKRPPTAWRSWMSVGIIATILALLPLLAFGLEQPFLVRVLTRVVVFAVAAVSLNILLGYAGLISVMHAAVLGLGGYVVAILASHANERIPFLPFAINGTTNLLISAPLAIVVTATVSAALGAIALRTRGAYFIMITLAFNQMLYYLFISLDRYSGDEGLQVTNHLHIGGIGLQDRAVVYYLCLVILVCTMVFAARLGLSRFGMVVRAASGNEQRVASVGIAATHYQLAVFVIAGAIAGLAGVLLVVSQQFVSPADMAWTRSGELIVMVVLGGTAAVWGPVAGAAVFLLLELLLSNITIHWQLPFGMLIILMVAFMRTGFVGFVHELKARLEGRPHND